MDQEPATGWSGGGPRTEGPTPFVVAEHELLGCIGRGSYGEVWLARNVMGILRAVKVLYRRNFKDERPFLREYEGIRRFEPVSRSHEGFVDILQIGQDAELTYFYYVMELGDDVRSASAPGVNGYVPRTLATELRGGPMPLEECIRIGISLSSALEQLHSQGLVHRDIKPSNIIFVGGAPKLADIGLVAEMNEARSYVGTEGFIPPEGPGTPQADVYGLGKVLYEISTGRDRMDFPALPTNLQENPEAGRLLELDEILRRACDADIKRRYASAWDLHSDLLLLNHGGSVRRLRTLERRMERAKRAGSLGVVILTVLGILAVPLFREWRAAIKERERQVATRIAQGVQFMEQGDMAAAFAAYVDAWQLDQGARENQPTHQLRIGAVLSQTPGVAGPWKLGDALTEAWFGPGEKTVVAVGDRAGAFEWSIAEGTSTTLALGTNPYRLVFDGAHARFATAHQARTATIWDATTRDVVLDLPHPAHVNGVSFSPNGDVLATGADDAFVRIWDAKGGTLLREWKAHEQLVTHVRFSPDGRRLASASWDRSARIWDPVSGRQIGPALSHDSWVGYVCFSPDGERLVTAGFDHVARVWDLGTGRQALPDLTHDDAVQSAEFSPDGSLILTTSLDGTARLWDSRTGRPAARYPVLRHPSHVKHAVFNRDGTRVLTAAMDGTVMVWDLAAASGHRVERVADRVFSGDGRRFATGGAQVRVSDTFSRETVGPAFESRSTLDHARLDRHGRLLFVQRPSTDLAPALIETFRVDSGRSLGTLAWGGTLPAYPGCSSPDGQWVGLVEPGHVFVRKMEGGLEYSLPHPQGVGMLRFSHDSHWLATAVGNEFRVFDLSNSGRVVGVVALAAPVSCLEFSPNGRHLAVACKDDQLTSHAARLFDPRTCVETARPLEHRDGIHGLQFSADSRRVVTAGEDFVARVWDSITGEPVTPPLRHRHQVWAGAFSPNGRWVATTGADRTARVWDARTGDPLVPPLSLPGMGASIVFLDDSPRILVGDGKGTWWLWDLTPAMRPLPELERIARTLSGVVSEERRDEGGELGR